MEQAVISFRADRNLKKKFDSLCEDFGLSASSAFNIFMKTVVRERRIPFSIRASSEKELRQDALAAFDAMRDAIKGSEIAEFSLEDINEEIKSSRNERKALRGN